MRFGSSPAPRQGRVSGGRCVQSDLAEGASALPGAAAEQQGKGSHQEKASADGLQVAAAAVGAVKVLRESDRAADIVREGEHAEKGRHAEGGARVGKQPGGGEN